MEFWGVFSLDNDVKNDLNIHCSEDIELYKDSYFAVFGKNRVLFPPESEEALHHNICSNNRYLLVADCRLDNRLDLAAKLSLSDTCSDAEYLMAAFLAYNDDCAKCLVGDFSFIVWDKHSHTLYLFKDHLGVRPDRKSVV